MIWFNKLWPSIRSYKKLDIILLSAGIIWTFYSDVVISFFWKDIATNYLELIRSINNLLIFGFTVFVLYRQVKKQRYRLVLSEKQYRNLFDSNPNPMWIYDKQTLAFIAVNEAAVAKYGYSRNEFLQLTIRDIRLPDDHKKLDEVTKDKHSGIYEAGMWHHIRKSGEIFPVSIVSHDVWFNRQTCKMVMATDITTVVRNEQKLRDAYLKEKKLHEELAINYELIRKSERENQVMAHVIDKINNLVLIVTEDSKISWVNKAFSEFTGYSLNEATGKTPDEILLGPQSDAETVGRIRHAVSQKVFFSEELVNYKKNGEAYWTQLTISPIYDENGDFQFFMSVETVITEKKKREQKIIAQHTALQKIAWSNSHELRRPVCSIMGLVSLLKDADNEKERDHCMQSLETCTRELDELLKSINKKIEELELDEALAG